ncbi:nucleoid-associated protein [uncultured Enterococcus sp.]|uniref:nucleoid-associated protein n=1 Tax=uncultured Enterococcus sp. TaxID=167972 RepID=UPI0025E4A590|nr:nucleoid-associated protein [uncultured Enterococcus sp.]
MDIYLKEAVVHIVDRETGDPILSSQPLDLSKEYIREYLEKKIKKASSPQTLVGTLEQDSKIGSLLTKRAEYSFIELSHHVVEKWYQAYQESEEAPSCDIFFVRFEKDANEYYAWLKVDFTTGYTHFIDSDDTGFINELLVHRALLSAITKKAEESFVVQADTLQYELLEKKYAFSGEKRTYFSNQVIETIPHLSFEQNIKVIQKTAEKIGEKFETPKVELAATIQEALAQTFEENETIELDQIATQVFKENITAQLAFKEEVEEKGVIDQAPMIDDVKELSARKFSKQKIKLSNGIELIIPMEMYRDPDYVEFIQQADGSLTVTLKDIQEITETHDM